MARRDPLLLALLWWTALVGGVLIWLPLTRGATQGRAYQWALTDGVGGRGIGGWYGGLVLGAAFLIPLLALGWRGARPPFHGLLLAFHLPLAAAVTYAAWKDPEGLRIEGATLGFSVSLAFIGPLLFLSAAAAAVFWVVRDLRSGADREPAPWVWTRATRVRLLLFVAIVPLEVVLFRSGGIQSLQNMVGVGLVGWQWILLNRILSGARGLPA